MRRKRYKGRYRKKVACTRLHERALKDRTNARFAAFVEKHLTQLAGYLKRAGVNYETISR